MLQPFLSCRRPLEWRKSSAGCISFTETGTRLVEENYIYLEGVIYHFLFEPQQHILNKSCTNMQVDAVLTSRSKSRSLNRAWHEATSLYLSYSGICFSSIGFISLDVVWNNAHSKVVSQNVEKHLWYYKGLVLRKLTARAVILEAGKTTDKHVYTVAKYMYSLYVYMWDFILPTADVYFHTSCKLSALQYLYINNVHWQLFYSDSNSLCLKMFFINNNLIKFG